MGKKVGRCFAPYHIQVIILTFKTPARGQNNWSRAWKLGIVCFSSFDGFGVKVTYVKNSFPNSAFL